MRSTLPPIPGRRRRRPVVNGYPLPWFVAEQPGGVYDFRFADHQKIPIAIRDKRCWICGEPLGSYKVFVGGPLGAVNRTTSEPPSHRECAHWAALACPFLNGQMRHRRDASDQQKIAPAGHMIPDDGVGVTLVWATESFSLFGDGRGGVLIEMGPPRDVWWYAGGKLATRAQVLAALEQQLHALRKIAEADGPDDVRELDRLVARAMRYVPS